jgi:hypothetical protein
MLPSSKIKIYIFHLNDWCFSFKTYFVCVTSWILKLFKLVNSFFFLFYSNFIQKFLIAPFITWYRALNLDWWLSDWYPETMSILCLTLLFRKWLTTRTKREHSTVRTTRSSFWKKYKLHLLLNDDKVLFEFNF